MTTLEQRVTDLELANKSLQLSFNNLTGVLGLRFPELFERLDRIDARLDKMDARLDRVEVALEALTRHVIGTSQP